MESKLDPKVLNSIRDLTEEGEPDFLTQLVKSFYERYEECYPKMLASAQAGDLGALEEVTHKFKGSAANISAIGVANLCQKLEGDARDKVETDFVSKVEEIKELYEFTKAELDKDWIRE